MPSGSIEKPPEYYRELERKCRAYRKHLISIGVPDRSNKMRKLMTRKGL